jgi:hypothetical protein
VHLRASRHPAHVDAALLASATCLQASLATLNPAFLLLRTHAHLPLCADRLNSMNSMSGRMYDSRVNQQALLGPRRPRPHKIWKKKFIKVGPAGSRAVICTNTTYRISLLVSGTSAAVVLLYELRHMVQ